jgi:hypothetical protein
MTPQNNEKLEFIILLFEELIEFYSNKTNLQPQAGAGPQLPEPTSWRIL